MVGKQQWVSQQTHIQSGRQSKSDKTYQSRKKRKSKINCTMVKEGCVAWCYTDGWKMSFWNKLHVKNLEMSPRLGLPTLEFVKTLKTHRIIWNMVYATFLNLTKSIFSNQRKQIQHKLLMSSFTLNLATYLQDKWRELCTGTLNPWSNWKLALHFCF